MTAFKTPQDEIKATVAYLCSNDPYKGMLWRAYRLTVHSAPEENPTQIQLCLQAVGEPVFSSDLTLQKSNAEHDACMAMFTHQPQLGISFVPANLNTLLATMPDYASLARSTALPAPPAPPQQHDAIGIFPAPPSAKEKKTPAQEIAEKVDTLIQSDPSRYLEGRVYTLSVTLTPAGTSIHIQLTSRADASDVFSVPTAEYENKTGLLCDRTMLREYLSELVEEIDFRGVFDNDPRTLKAELEKQVTALSKEKTAPDSVTTARAKSTKTTRVGANSAPRLFPLQ